MSDAWTIRKWDAYECAGDENRLYTVWLPEGQEVKDEMVVEAVLVVLYHRRAAIIEYRLTRARRCR
jgi:hypothetical protein